MQIWKFLPQIVPGDIFAIPDTKDERELAQALIEQCHPGATKMRLLQLGADEAVAEIPYAQENRALHGFMHGGCLFTVGDTMTAIMCMYHVEHESQRMLTMNASIRYLRAVQKDTVQARARLVKRDGPRLDFVCEFFNAAGKRAAQGKYAYALTEPR